jgi:hypothetical protein
MFRCFPLLLLAALASSAGRSQEPGTESATDPGTRFETLVLRGKVDWLGPVLARRHGVRLVPEAGERVLVLETVEGDLHPLLEDVRGRSFRRDSRFRQIEVELTVRRHRGSPFIQVIQICEVRPDGRYLLDYWCDICAIVMFELKECDCCQGPIELRHTLVPEK